MEKIFGNYHYTFSIEQEKSEVVHHCYFNVMQVKRPHEKDSVMVLGSDDVEEKQVYSGSLSECVLFVDSIEKGILTDWRLK